MRHWKQFATAILITAVGATSTLAFDERQYQAVKDGQSDCPWCDLSNADLSDISFAGINLKGADLSGADLAGTTFANVNLSGADLTGAVVTGAKLMETDLKGADLDQVDLSGAVLVGVNLESAYCDWATKLPEGVELECSGVILQRK